MTACWVGTLPVPLQEKDFVFTDDLEKVPFAASSGRLFFLEGLGSELNERLMPRQGHVTWQKQRIEIGGGSKKAATFMIFYLGRPAFGVQYGPIILSHWTGFPLPLEFTSYFSLRLGDGHHTGRKGALAVRLAPQGRTDEKSSKTHWHLGSFLAYCWWKNSWHWGCIEHDQTV